MSRFYKYVTFLLPVILGASNLIFGQETKATLFFHDGEAIEGLAKIVKNTVNFKVAVDSKADIWDFYSITGLELSDGAYNIHYDYVEVSKQKTPLLLELVESGKVYLYTKTKTRGRAKGLNKVVKSDGTVTINTDELSKLNFEGEKVYEYYLKRKDGFEAICINCGILGMSDSWLKKTATFFEDCDVLQKKLLDNEFTLEEMIDIVQFYNDFCTEE